MSRGGAEHFCNGLALEHARMLEKPGQLARDSRPA